GNAELNKIVTENSDVITFHCYGKKPAMIQQIAQWKKLNRPVWCTEWLNRPSGSVLSDIMPELKKSNTGSYIWGLVQGKTQTHLPWGHRPEKLPYTGPWQHDLYNTDFTPYKQDEIDFIKQLCKVPALLEGQWSTEKANDWYAAVLAEKKRIAGVNFLPSTAVNDVEMWQSSTFDKETIDKELGWAEQWGINSVRVFLNYVVWEAEAEAFKKNFAAFLDIAEKHKITVMPILFDDCNFQGGVAKTGKQPEPVPGVHNSGWVSSPPLAMLTDPSAEPKLKKYLQDIVKTFGQDKRILVWDLYNEPGNSGMGEKHFNLVKNTFAWAREMKPSQPLTIGVWHNFNNRMSKMFLSDADVVSFHGYDTVGGMKTKIAICECPCRPVFCTEWLLRQNGDNLPQKMLPLFAGHEIGIYNWGLVAGRTQTYFHWGSKKGTAEPAVWQHDLIKADGTPYRPQELRLFRKFVSGDDSPVLVGEVLTPTADLPPVWKYTESKPADDWTSPNFDDSAWKSGAAPFGAEELNIDRQPNTVWKSNKIYLRRTFELGETQRKALSDKTLELRMYYDENPVVYLNGVKIKDGLFYTNQYETFTVDAAPLKTGRNVLSIECSNTAGGQYIDAGLIGQ
ncbi:MAG: cellulase family glycosylhydrolase, partial [Planctomycetaceae bacterium]|nr:cellulase family glycosylhydrolase [Planctomycetaceae bacterium]